jgi:hypothetical protein
MEEQKYLDLLALLWERLSRSLCCWDGFRDPALTGSAWDGSVQSATERAFQRARSAVQAGVRIPTQAGH